jgi:ABC-type nitrate/sulfonate/bicarbonate transport system permease component
VHSTMTANATGRLRLPRPISRGSLHSSWLLSIGSLAVVLAVWELVVAVGLVSPRHLPPPSRVATAGLDLLTSGGLLGDLAISVGRALAGYVIGSVVAVAVALATGRSPLIRGLLEPTLQVLRPIPALAWVPFSILWFGIGEGQKVFVIALGVFFPVWLNSHLGVAGTPARYLNVARTLGATRRDLFLRVSLPAALPLMVAGLRQGIALAFLLLVAAELTGASSGLGALISQAHLLFRPDQMIVGLVLLGVLGAVVDFLFARAARRLVPWS